MEARRSRRARRNRHIPNVDLRANCPTPSSSASSARSFSDSTPISRNTSYAWLKRWIANHAFTSCSFFSSSFSSSSFLHLFLLGSISRPHGQGEGLHGRREGRGRQDNFLLHLILLPPLLTLFLQLLLLFLLVLVVKTGEPMVRVVVGAQFALFFVISETLPIPQKNVKTYTATTQE
jgi:hypothetical protein